MTEKIINKTIDQADSAKRLDRWLRELIPGIQQSLIEKLLRKGQIRLDGKKATSNSRLMEGQKVSIPQIMFSLEVSTQPKRDVQLTIAQRQWLEQMIIYQDEDMLVLNKPADLAVQGGSKITKSLDTMLGALFPGQRPKLVHRLDKDTSGVLIFARHLKAAQYLTKSFANKTVQKVYWALVVGAPPRPSGTIELPLRKTMKGEFEKIFVDEQEGLKAVTRYRIIEKLGKKLTWLELIPLTGRTHQLRVHCAEGLKTPIVGDGKYGGSNAYPFGRVPLQLHAWEITLTSLQGKKLTFCADLPPHMIKTWQELGLKIDNYATDG